MRRVNQLLALSSKEWQLLLFALAALPVIGLSLTIFGLRRTQGGLARIIPATCKSPPDPELEAKLAARAVGIAARRGLYRAGCLRSALLLWWWLQRCGIAADLRIGFNKGGGQFNAHAWLEVQGTVVFGGEDVHRHFVPLL